MANASDLKVGTKVTIIAEVTRLSNDKAEVTVRLPHYGYPITLPINSVEMAPPEERPDHGPKPAKRKSYAGKSAFAKAMNEEE